ncbi:MAG: hypothetical protein V1649_01425 [Patescibacteria group bacterium]
MNRLLILLLGLFGTTEKGENTIKTIKNNSKYAKKWYNVFIGIVLACIGVVFLGFLCNIAGVKGINILFSIAFAAIVLVLHFKPITIAIVAVAGAVEEALRNNSALSEGAEKFLKIYMSLLHNVLLWGSIIFFFLGHVSFKENPWALVVIITTIFLLQLIFIVWKIGGNFYKKIVYGSAMFILITSILSLIPRETWIKITGCDLKGAVSVSKAEKSLAQIERVEKEKADEAISDQLKAIGEKIKHGETLTVDEKAFLEEQKSQRNEKKLWRQIANAFPKKTVLPPPRAETAQYSGKVLTISLSPNEIYTIDNVYEGQSWQYLSFNGPFYGRVDRGDGRASWEMVKNNSTWRADCAGQLQAKAGNTPVVLTLKIFK